MQVVLSQRMAKPSRLAAVAVPRAAQLNPSPYMFYYDMATSTWSAPRPRSWCGWNGDTVTCGRSPAPARAAHAEEDEALAKELLADPKELAEHVMLIDLGRNDVGRVAQTGTRARSPRRWSIERYSHVMHIVSNVEGKLKPGLTTPWTC